MLSFLVFYDIIKARSRFVWFKIGGRKSVLSCGQGCRVGQAQNLYFTKLKYNIKIDKIVH